MRLKKIIKRFIFEEENRSQIALGSSVRLNPLINRLQLEEDSNDLYSTAADLYGATWITNPTSVRQWIGFEVFAEHSLDTLGDPLTSLGFRLGNGTDQYYWNGASWEINTTDWNTEAEISNNISTFSAVSQKLQVFVNLVTTDETVTPLVQEIRVLYSSNIEFEEDIIIRSFVPMLRENIRPIGDFPFALTADTSTIDLANDYILETPYNVVGIDSVFNHTNDPDHWTDIYQSFNSTTQVITLTGAQTAGEVLWVKFIYEPEVAASTSQVYSEVEKVPSLILTDIGIKNPKRIGASTGVINRDSGQGTKIHGQRQCDIEITIRGNTASNRDQTRLADNLREFFIDNKMVISKGLDEKYRLSLVSEYVFQSEANQSEIYSGFLRVRIIGVLFSQEQDEDVYAVLNLKLVGDTDVVIN